MKIDAQHKFIEEITRTKVFIVRDQIKGGIREEENPYTGESIIVTEEEDHIKFGEYTIAGFPFLETYFKHLHKRVNSFLQEINANKYDKTCNYEAYLDDLRIEIERLMQTAFEDFHGLTRYKYFTEIVHVDFMNVDHHWQLVEIPPDHLLNRRIHDFSSQLAAIIFDIQEKLATMYSGNKAESVDTRISCRANREEIQNFFYRLDRLNSDGDQILTREQIDHFLQVNFQGFGEPIKRRILNPVGLTEADIRYFIYDFINRFDPKGDRQIYARICKDSFLQFEKSEISSIASNFSKKPKKYFLG